MRSYKRHHYVPQWYQYRFLLSDQKENKFFYLDQKPDVITLPNGNRYARNNLLRWGPPKCFYETDLYTTKYRDWESTEIEEMFFGKIDDSGRKAVDYFTNFEHPSANGQSFNALLPYMSAQKLRTQKGIPYLASLIQLDNKNELLMEMQRLHRMHCALWTECVWSIVDATDSETKFICSDHPITVYNQKCFPESKWCRETNDPGIWLDGTYTIFPLTLNKALILTNLSWVRNPYGNPLKERPNPKLFRPAMFKFTDIQTGRKLEEKEVIAINYIIKKRSYRYIAAAKEEWLYPEKYFTSKRWDKIGESYLLMPDPRSVSFSSEIIMGYKDGTSDSFDEYGRKPWDRNFRDKQRHAKEWDSFHAFQGEYARLNGPKRKGLTYSFGDIDKEIDSDDFHAYHLSLESKLKHKFKKRKRK